MRSDTVEVQELESLTRHYADLVRAFRLDTFRERLERGTAAAVLRNRCGFGGDRWTVWFRDGGALRLSLYYPVRIDITEVVAVRWLHDVWQVDVRAISGETLRLLAYRVSFHPAR